MDEVPIPLRAFLPTTYPSDADVLKMIGAKCLSNHRALTPEK
jgi:hypothetical protein